MGNDRGRVRNNFMLKVLTFSLWVERTQWVRVGLDPDKEKVRFSTGVWENRFLARIYLDQNYLEKLKIYWKIIGSYRDSWYFFEGKFGSSI